MKYYGVISDSKDLITKEYADERAVNYGVCSTGASTAAKVVSIEGITELTAGLSIRVKFSNAQTYNGAPTLNLNSLGAKNIRRNGTTNAARYEWMAGEVLDLVYDGTAWLIADGGIATTTYYGQTKLATSATSTSTALALTPASLNNLADHMLTGLDVYSTSATYAVGDRVRYGYYIYECTTAITTPEAWDADHWKVLKPLLELIDEVGGSVEPATAAPAMDGTAAVGTSVRYAREDHVHPRDTGKVDASVSLSTVTTEIGNNGADVYLLASNSSNTQQIYVDVDAALSKSHVVIHSELNGNSNEFTVSPTATTIHKVVAPTADADAANKKYVDDAVAGAGLPAVTSADNGKFLRVVDGAWAAATIPSAAGVSF